MKQEYKVIPTEPGEIRHIARKMRRDNVILAMIHGYLDDDGEAVISYEYQVEPGVESYSVRGHKSVPSISDIYDKAAEWPERELNELYGFEFEGLDTSKRLFLPDNMLSGQGQIIVTPMDELIRDRYVDKGDTSSAGSVIEKVSDSERSDG